MPQLKGFQLHLKDVIQGGYFEGDKGIGNPHIEELFSTYALHGVYIPAIYDIRDWLNNDSDEDFPVGFDLEVFKRRMIETYCRIMMNNNIQIDQKEFRKLLNSEYTPEEFAKNNLQSIFSQYARSADDETVPSNKQLLTKLILGLFEKQQSAREVKQKIVMFSKDEMKPSIEKEFASEAERFYANSQIIRADHGSGEIFDGLKLKRHHEEKRYFNFKSIARLGILGGYVSSLLDAMEYEISTQYERIGPKNGGSCIYLDKEDRVEKIVFLTEFSPFNDRENIVSRLACCVTFPEEMKDPESEETHSCMYKTLLENMTFTYMACNQKGFVNLPTDTPIRNPEYAHSLDRFKNYSKENWKKLSEDTFYGLVLLVGSGILVELAVASVALSIATYAIIALCGGVAALGTSAGKDLYDYLSSRNQWKEEIQEVGETDDERVSTTFVLEDKLGNSEELSREPSLDFVRTMSPRIDEQKEALEKVKNLTRAFESRRENVKNDIRASEFSGDERSSLINT